MWKVIAIIFIISFFCGAITSIQSDSLDTELSIILDKCAKYCEKLGNSVLDFVCEERIREEIHHYKWTRPEVASEVISGEGEVVGQIVVSSSGHQEEKNDYLYDYQLVRQFNRVDEKRILLKENGKNKNEKNAELKTKRFKYESIILGPIGLLSEFWQKFYNYRIIKKKKFKGDRVIILEATPKPNIQSDYLYGKLWVKEDDCSVVKIEWTPESVGQFKIIADEAKRLNAQPVINFYAEYAFEKNGVRFPSKLHFSEGQKFSGRSYLRRRQKYARSETTVVYRNYKFFTVKTEVKYRQ